MNSIFKILLCSLLVCNLCEAQNLVPNHDFENYSNQFCGIMLSPEFNNTMIDWVNPTGASPQVFFTNNADSCYNHQPVNSYPGPIGIKGSQMPRSGNVMVGLWLYTIHGFNQRQYVQNELITPMISGKTYKVEFYVSLADSMEKSINKIGAYLSVNPISATDSAPLNYSPQVGAEGFIDDMINWILISDTIVAQDDYAFLTIGNFYDDNSTDTLDNPLSSGAPGTYGAFYFLDDVIIEEINTTGIQDVKETGISIYPTRIINELNFEVTQKSLVEIFDMSGRLVYSSSVNIGLTTVIMEGFQKGIYIVSVRNKDGYICRKVVK